MEPDMYGRVNPPEEEQPTSLSLPRAQTWKIVLLTLVLLVLLIIFGVLVAVARGYNIKQYVPDWVLNNQYVSMWQEPYPEPAQTPSPDSEMLDQNQNDLSPGNSKADIQTDLDNTDIDFSEDFTELDTLFGSY